MKINISNLSEGTHTYQLSTSAEKLGLGSNLIGEVGAHVTLEKSINQFFLNVHASVKGVFVCDRCVREYEETISAEFTSVYSWDQDEATDEKDDYYVLSQDQNIIDISDSVKEYVTLAVPLKLLCNTPECEIPLHVEKEEQTIDPRWEKLKVLKQSK